METHKIARDPFGRALWDFYHGQFVPPLLLHTAYGPPEPWEVEGFFYDSKDFSEIEDFALSLCKGKILDVGAAAGRHALALQLNKTLEVYALDSSKYCCELMHLRGVQHTIYDDIFDYSGTGFDTILMMLNGIGLCGTLHRLEELLLQLKLSLNACGQIIFDSSDVSYLVTEEFNNQNKYYGELTFRFEYRDVLGEWFEWLYIDQKKLCSIASACGWISQVLYEDETGNYLVRLIR